MCICIDVYVYAPEGVQNCEDTNRNCEVVHSYKIYNTFLLASHESVCCWTNPVNEALK